jgi:hypothetical protein
MTKLLDKAFEEASRLPERDQNALAKWVLDELQSEWVWARTFAESEDVLGDGDILYSSCQAKNIEL